MTQRFAILRTAAQSVVSVCTETGRFRCALLAAVIASSVAAGTSWAIPCTDIDTQCMTAGTCQADGSCLGTNKPNGTPCQDSNDCTIDDACQNGHCAGGSFADEGTLCQSVLGKCLKSAAHCQLLGFCIPDDFDIVDCPPGPDLCNLNFCNPGTGECMSIHIDCNEFCATSQCNPETGECTAAQPRNEGQPCDDFNECTDAHCQAGECTTPGGPGPTNTPIPTTAPTVTPTPVSSDCVGDCSGDRNVVIDELRAGVGLTLGYEASCDAFGAPVTVDKLIRGVRAALEGCAVLPPTPTPTQTVIGPTPTVTPTVGGPSIPGRAAGVIEGTTSAFLTIPNVLSALLGHLPGSGLSATGSGASDIINTNFDCTTGGGHLTCSQIFIPPFTFGPPTYTVDFNSCVVGTLAFNGSLTGAAQQGSCLSIPSQLALSTNNLSITNTTAAGSTTATFTNVQNASIALSCSGGSCSCTYDTVTMQLNGTLTVVSTAGTTVTSTAATFHTGSSILIRVQQYGSKCVPTDYDMTVNGRVTLVNSGNIFDGTFDTYKLDATQIGDATSVEVTGAVTSACVGAKRLSFLTLEPLNIPGVDPCPTAGLLRVTYDTTTDDLRFTNGMVEINNGAGGTFNSCLSPSLLVCPGS